MINIYDIYDEKIKLAGDNDRKRRILEISWTRFIKRKEELEKNVRGNFDIIELQEGNTIFNSTANTVLNFANGATLSKSDFYSIGGKKTLVLAHIKVSNHQDCPHNKIHCWIHTDFKMPANKIFNYKRMAETGAVLLAEICSNFEIAKIYHEAGGKVLFFACKDDLGSENYFVDYGKDHIKMDGDLPLISGLMSSGGNSISFSNEIIGAKKHYLFGHDYCFKEFYAPGEKAIDKIIKGELQVVRQKNNLDEDVLTTEGMLMYVYSIVNYCNNNNIQLIPNKGSLIKLNG